jgi:hypothetical protein
VGNSDDTGTTTIAAYRGTVATLQEEQRELSARLNEKVTMPELLERIVAEWRASKTSGEQA